MAISYSFVDNEVYGTQDINDIASSIVGAGVAPFKAKNSYNVSDLNAMTQAMVQMGTSLDGCKCSVKNAGTLEMTATVGQGIVFFESGVRMVVDEEGYELPVTPNTRGYIYAYYRPSLQKAEISFSKTFPESGEYVLLAQIGEDGKIEDKRTFARAKIATMGRNVEHSIPASKITLSESFDSAEVYKDTRKILAKIDLSGLDLTKFKYLMYKYTGWSYNYRVKEMFERYIDIPNQNEVSFYIRGTGYYDGTDVIKILLEGDKLLFLSSSYVAYEWIMADISSAVNYFKLM